MSDVKNMRRDFADRADLIAYLRETFPRAAEVSDVVPAEPAGGRPPAETRLSAVDPVAYKRTRNHLDGAVSHLSPYIRYGVLTLAEVRDAVLEMVDKPRQASKFINELGWRDYYQRVYSAIGDGIWEDREPYKTGFSAADYADELPDDIRRGTTGTVMDIFCRELVETGYLHNHARMWLAAYVVHWRRVRWQAGAGWFLEHLLDGDPASNNLSWQWVASTFSHRPYIFNRRNLQKYGVDLAGYPAGDCPFNASYDELNERLFPHQ